MPGGAGPGPVSVLMLFSVIYTVVLYYIYLFFKIITKYTIRYDTPTLPVLPWYQYCTRYLVSYNPGHSYLYHNLFHLQKQPQTSVIKLAYFSTVSCAAHYTYLYTCTSMSRFGGFYHVDDGKKIFHI